MSVLVALVALAAVVMVVLINQAKHQAQLTLAAAAAVVNLAVQAVVQELSLLLILTASPL
jgi:hypothetical protein